MQLSNPCVHETTRHVSYLLLNNSSVFGDSTWKMEDVNNESQKDTQPIHNYCYPRKTESPKGIGLNMTRLSGMN